jgi:hypothetical protein
MNRHQRRHLREVRQAAGSALVAPIAGEDRLEKGEQWEVVKLYRALGCKVYSQPRATMQTEGLGDLFVVCPRKRLAWWHESKRRIDGDLTKQTEEQIELQRLMDLCGIPYVLGGFKEAFTYLREIGVIRV